MSEKLNSESGILISEEEEEEMVSSVLYHLVDEVMMFM